MDRWQSIKSGLNFALARWPPLYRAVLKARGSRNNEKLAYLRLIENGQTVFDLGANVGYYTILFSHLVGSSGRVYAFEPVPPTFETLTGNLKRQLFFDNVVAVRGAVSNRDQQDVDIFVPASDYEQASLAMHTTGSWADAQSTSYRTNAVTLDKFIADRKIRRLDFIKLDVEGAELSALQGGRETLMRHRPIILLEYFGEWARHFNASPGALVSYLGEVGYRFFYTDDLAPLPCPAEQLAAIKHSTHVICSASQLA